MLMLLLPPPLPSKSLSHTHSRVSAFQFTFLMRDKVNQRKPSSEFGGRKEPSVALRLASAPARRGLSRALFSSFVAAHRQRRALTWPASEIIVAAVDIISHVCFNYHFYMPLWSTQATRL